MPLSVLGHTDEQKVGPLNEARTCSDPRVRSICGSLIGPDLLRTSEPGKGSCGGTTTSREPRRRSGTRLQKSQPCRNSLPRRSPRYSQTAADPGATANALICRCPGASSQSRPSRPGLRTPLPRREPRPSLLLTIAVRAFVVVEAHQCPVPERARETDGCAPAGLAPSPADATVGSKPYPASFPPVAGRVRPRGLTLTQSKLRTPTIAWIISD